MSGRDAQALGRIFDWFGEVECPQLDAHLYRALCRGIKGDPELLEIAGRAPATQPPPNLLFAAVHYLLLKGEPHELREFYPALAEGAVREPGAAFPAFRAFCLAHREEIENSIETRLTQTNVIQRSSVLLPAFARLHRTGGATPLALVEIGPSAGLNMQWYRFRYSYDGGATRWGDPGSPVLVECELRGGRALPELPDRIPVVWRRGVDLSPVDIADPDAVLWLRALVWPDHAGRQERLSAAIEIARRDPPEIVTGSADEHLSELLRAAPAGATLGVYATHTLYQFPPDALRRTLRIMQDASHLRPVDFVSMEGSGDRFSEVRHTAYRDGARTSEIIARANPHGRWLEWLV